MRNMLALAPAALAAACMADAPEATRSEPGLEQWAEFAAQHPNILLASPEATNYAPPGWPFEPGQEVTWDDQWDILHRGRWEGRRTLPRETPRAYDPRLVAQPIVWVVSHSGPKGAMPFGPWIDVAGEDKFRYYGHLPVYYGPRDRFGCCFDTEDIPAPLRGTVNPDDHLFDPGTMRVVDHKFVGRTNPRPGYSPFLPDSGRGICDIDDEAWRAVGHEEMAKCAEKYLAHARTIHYGPEASW